MKPVRLLLGIALLCLCANNSKAQTPDTSTTQGLLQYIFQNIDKSQIPTGFLEEYGAPMLPMATFNGTLTDSNRIDMNLWRTLYFQTQTGYTGGGTNPLPAITSVNTTIKQNANDTLPVPIPLFIAQYNTVRDDAFSGNMLSYNSSQRQIYDVTNRTQSPYQLNALFAACPNKQVSLTGSENFLVKSNLIWNTSGKTVSGIQVNFDNTLGFQNITIGTPITVSYADTGAKRWTIKVTFTDNTVWQCYSDYYVLRPAANNGAARYQPNIFNFSRPFPATANHSGGRIFISYTNLNSTNTLRKPLIVVEGYDISRIAPNIQSNYRYRDFINAINEPRSTYDFNQQLDEIAGYDIVFIDFNNGTDDIRRNAALVEEVIDWVNTNKVPNSNNGNIIEQNVVMGLSMGGLVARYALAEMTKNNVATGTRLLITHDSPHRGANVPLGLQYFIRMMGGFQLFGFTATDIYPQYNEAIALLGEPATQQLLIYRATSANAYATNTFLDNEYRTMITFSSTDPQPSYRFVATALGNECSHPLFSPGKTFFNLGAGAQAGIYARFLFFTVPILSYKLAAEAEAYALPNTGNVTKIARLYTVNNLKLFGLIDIFKQLYNNTAVSSGTQLAIDGVPGSVSPLLDIKALSQITNLPVFNQININFNFPLGPLFGGYFGIYAYNAGVSPTFTFVPAASALDVSPFDGNAVTDTYVNGSNATHPSTSETFIAQETNNTAGTSNNAHIRFTARNSQWLFDEMENLNNNLNCSSECSNPYYIAGNNNFCTASTAYSIPGLPRGATVTWSASPSGIATFSCTTCVSTTLTRVTSGVITLTATITNACGGGSVTLTKQNIRVGPPTGIGIVAYNNLGTCDGNSYFQVLAAPQPSTLTYSGSLTVGESSGVTSGVTWSLPPFSSSGSWSWYASGSTVTVGVKQSNVSLTLRATATNSCGTVFKDYHFTSRDCPPMVDLVDGGQEGAKYSIGPNPTNGTFAAMLKDPADPAASIKEIVIKNKLGTVVKHLKFTGKSRSQTVNVQDLPTDVYVVQLFTGKEWFTGKLIKQ